MAVLTSINIQSRARMRSAHKTKKYIDSLSKEEREKYEEEERKKAEEKREMKKLRHDRLAAAANPNTPREKFFELIDLNDFDVTYVCLKNPKCPVEILDRFSTVIDSNLRHVVASNPSTPKKVVEKLANDENYIIRCEVAKREDISLDMLRKFLKDPIEHVRRQAGLHPKISFDELYELAKVDDTLKYDFEIIARREDTTVEQFYKLADCGPYVAKLMIDNKKVPIGVLNKLLRNKNPEVVSRARFKLETIAGFKNLTLEDAKELLKSNDVQVLITLSYNENCPKEVMEELSKNRKVAMFSKTLRKFKRAERLEKSKEKKAIKELPKQEEQINIDELEDGPKLR